MHIVIECALTQHVNS